YSLVALPLERFDAKLLRELRSECAATVSIEGDQLILGHVYIERRMQPLNLHLDDCRRDSDQAGLRSALREYGQAIKELAGAGIFPGDMLLKNFGITRHDRVVFYDYDEIAPMTELAFRSIPAASWGEKDVFPEQFERYLVTEPAARQIFYEYHRDLLDPAF